MLPNQTTMPEPQVNEHVEPVTMKVTDFLVRFLHSRGVRTVFELPGGMITHILNSLFEFDGIRVISVHHEQAAAFAADAVGRLTGVPGIALATSGPGATNLLTGIGSCFFDSSPAVFITGQVNRHELRGERPIRQLGFQESDIVTMARPVSKAAWQILEPEAVPGDLERAFNIALSGRPGPVLLDIPMDVQNTIISVPADYFDDRGTAPDGSSSAPILEEYTGHLNPATWELLRTAIRESRRPLILAGAGVRASNTAEPFQAFVEQLGIPVVNSLLAVDLLPYENPLRVGMIGSYGNRWANYALGQSDLLIVLGSRLDIRQTGNDTAFFKGERTIFHVDVEAGELNNRIVGCIAVHTELKSFFAEAKSALAALQTPDWSSWLNDIADARKQYDDQLELHMAEGINPNFFMHQLAQRSQSAGAFLVDVGQHQMWAAQSIEVGAEQRWLTSGGMGSMGFALPAAIGAAAAQGRPVVVIAGDGGFQCNLQELQTVVRNQMPIKMVIMNNRSHGMVRQFQQSYFKEQYQSTIIGYDAPDFVRVAEAFGIPARHMRDLSEVESALDFLWSDPASPCLLEVQIDTFTNVYPKIAFGHPLTHMEPHAEPVPMRQGQESDIDLY